MAAKSEEAKHNQASRQAKWQRDHLDRISVCVPAGRRDVYRQIAESRGVSLNRLINDYLESLVDEKDHP